MTNNKTIAVIYVRGNQKEMQEMFCTLCAVERGYKVAFATDNLDDVKDCDILIVTNPSRISRNETEYYKIVNNFKEKGIEVEFAVDNENLIENLELAKQLLNEH